MTPSARAQAAIELVDAIIESARDGGAAADSLIGRYFRARRYAGSKDRRAIRDLVFRAIRRSGERPVSGRAALVGLAREERDLAALFDGSPHGPAPIDENEMGADSVLAPQWLGEQLDPLIDAQELEALLERAPLDLRVNRLKVGREAGLAQFDEAEPTPHSPIGLRLAEGFQVEQTEAWRNGLVEVQDEGSQLISLGCDARPGMFVVDLCAGAGGKTLALAAEMSGKGTIVACDTDRARLRRMMPRLERAGVDIVAPILLDPGKEEAGLRDLAGKADLVLVDAPCSGTGTWRRNPETRWRLTPDRLARLAALQARLLDVGAELVRPGGHLVYAVCSVLTAEGRDQAEALSRRSSLFSEPPDIHAGRPAGRGLLLTPARDGTDGFFVARWHRPC